MSAPALAGRRDAALITDAAAVLIGPLLLLLFTGRILVRDDLGALHLPFRYLYQQALTTGRLLLWTPAYHSGFFLYGAGEAGMLHPLHVALYRFLPLATAFNLEIIASYVSLFCGSACLLRRLGVSLEGALFGAMTFAFSGFTLYNLTHVNHIGTFAHAPWMLLATLQLSTAASNRERAWAFMALAAVTGLQLLAGNPQYVWLTWIAVGYFMICRVVAQGNWRWLPLTVGAMAAGVAIGAVQLLPTLEFLGDSPRAGWTAESALTFSLSPLNVIQLWSPFAFEFRVAAPPAEQFIVHEFIVYNGAFCTAALIWVAMRYRSLRPRGLIVALLIFTAINLLLAFGRYGGVYPLLARLPGVGAFRAPARHLLLVQMAMSGLAAVAFDDLRDLGVRGLQPSWRQLSPFAALAGAAVLTAMVAQMLANTPWAAAHGLHFSGWARSGPWTLVVLAMTSLVVSAARGHRWAIPALICLSALDLGVWGYSYLVRWGTFATPAALAEQAPAEARAGELIPTVDGGLNEYGILRGLRLTDGYTGLDAVAILNPREPATQRLAGVNWRYDSGRWARVTDALPRVRLVAASIVSTSPGEQLNAIDAAAIALVDRPLALSGARGTARLTHELPGQFEVETTAEGRQLMVTTEKFHDGWHATIDGNPAPVLRAYGDFLACEVPPGSHRVMLTFRPRGFVVGEKISSSALLAVLAATLWLWRGRPRTGLTR